jgi:hypothetical protein
MDAAEMPPAFLPSAAFRGAATGTTEIQETA